MGRSRIVKQDSQQRVFRKDISHSKIVLQHIRRVLGCVYTQRFFTTISQQSDAVTAKVSFIATNLRYRTASKIFDAGAINSPAVKSHIQILSICRGVQLSIFQFDSIIDPSSRQSVYTGHYNHSCFFLHPSVSTRKNLSSKIPS